MCFAHFWHHIIKPVLAPKARAPQGQAKQREPWEYDTIYGTGYEGVLMHHLPTGTVTLFFTDIEGSTQLLQLLGDRYTSVLAECRRLLRTAFEEWHGQEVDTQGDAFFVAFARATDAVSAAVAAQRALAAHHWPEGVDVRVRVGLHTGEPALAAEGYVGIDVHQAARIMAAGYGGQVLISQATRDLVVHSLPNGVDLRNMGEQQLKDIQRSGPLFQLVIADLPNDFPPLRSASVHAHNLPVLPTPLIGRTRELAAIGQLVGREDVRLVTLTGPGGIGKTRLALQAGVERGGEFNDGIYYVDLAPFSDPALVIPAIAQTLGLQEEGGQPLLEHLKEFLRQKQVLLLLDNFEQVLDAAVEVAGLLVACQRLKLVVTSRATLRVRAEHEFVVPPLAFPNSRHMQNLEAFARFEAIALFLQRARTVKSDFRLTATNAPVVMDIVRRLDGLPLAIELAAARIRLLSPEALRSRLSSRLPLLTSNARDVVARQQTLRNTIEWSYNLLDAQEQRLFRRLSIFVGGCVPEAAEAFCASLDGGAESTLDTLGSLLDKSLWQRKEQAAEEEPRFVMLETIREYGLEALTLSGELEAVREAHAFYFLAFAQRAAKGFLGREEVWWLERLEQEHDNIRAAMQWSLEQTGERRSVALRTGIALRPFWYTRGHLSEGLDFLERAITQSDMLETSLRAEAIYAAARLHEVRGNHDRAEALLTECLALFRTGGNRANIAYALHLQADIAWGRGDLAMANAQAEESLAILRELADKGGIANLLLHLGGVASDQGDYPRACELLEESLVLNREQAERSSIAESLFNLARVYFFSQGDPARTRAMLEESLAIYEESGDKESIAYDRWLLGLLALEQGDMASARACIEQSMKLFKEMRQQHGTALTVAALAKVSAVQGDRVLARSLYEESLQLARTTGARLNVVQGLEGLAAVVAADGRCAWAARLWGAAEALREAITAPLPPVEHVSYERAVAAARAQLGGAAFDAEWAAGRASALEGVLLDKIVGTVGK